MITDPHEILGVPREATLAEVEARYRLLLRTCHPDLHHAEGPDAVAEAEAMTQRLNWAIAVIRGRTTGPPPPGAAPGPSGTGPGRGATGAGRGQWAGDNPFYRPPEADPDAEPDIAGGGPRGPGTGAHQRPGPRPGDPPWAEYDWFGNRVDQGPHSAVPCPFCGRPFEDLPSYEVHLERDHRYRRVTMQRRRSRGRFSRMVGSLRYLPAWFLVLANFVLLVVFGFYAFIGGMAFLALVLWTQTGRRFRGR